MKTRKALPLAAISLSLALAAAFANAADFMVTDSQLSELKPGITFDEVTRVLGAPEDTTSWINGSQSLVYEMSGHDHDQQLVYVNLGKNGKMTDFQVVDR